MIARNAHFFFVLAPALLLLACFPVGCGDSAGDATGDSQGQPADSSAEEPLSGRLTVYCGRGDSMVESLFATFRERTGVEVNVIYDRTPVLATKLMQEREQTPADVFFAQDPGYLATLAKAGMFADLPAELLAPVDERLRDAEGRWVGTSGRLRVLAYNPERISRDQLPRTLQEFAEPRFASVSWAPANGSLHAHVSALRHLWGEEQTRAFLTALRDKDAQRFNSNRPQITAVAAGDVDVAWVNHYYLHQMRAQSGELPVENYSFPAADAGNVMMVAGCGVLRTSQNPRAAQALIEFLLSEEAQQHFAQANYEYPTRRGVPTHPDVPPLSEVPLVEVPQAALADIGPTIALLQELGLQ